MRNTNKKGFTIVELVIVVAVIAILAAVLIPTFSGIIAKANLSADQQAVRNMNTALATYTETEKEISDIMSHLRSFGFSYEKMVTYSKGYHYCYSKDNNKMYLLDDNNTVVYPENESVAIGTLWAAYKNHATSMIPGITQYYATQTVASQEEFNSAFASGTFVLDLNDNVCTVNGNANVTVLNGYTVNGGFATDSDVTVVSESKEGVNTTTSYDADGKITKIVYNNVLDPSGISSGTDKKYSNATIEYVNCVFTNQPGFYQNGQSVNLVFDNCTFTHSNGFAVILQPGSVGAASTVTFDSCNFVNNDRGIHISAWENTTVNVTNCNFAIKTGDSKYNCVQISNYENDDNLASLKLNFTNNTVASANGVVYFHDNMTGPQNLDSFKGVLNFSGNTYAEKVALLADRGEYKSGHFLFNNTEAMKALEALIK